VFPVIARSVSDPAASFLAFALVSLPAVQLASLIASQLDSLQACQLVSLIIKSFPLFFLHWYTK